MKRIFLLILLLTLANACATKPQVNDYGGSLPEMYRAGTPLVEPYPNYYHRISHTCTSTPIYDLYGYYVRTDIRCW